MREGEQSSVLNKACGIAVVALVFTVAALAANNEQVLYTFAGGNDGANPYAGLTQDKAGNLYGTTVGGGTYGYGAVFELTRVNDTWTEIVLHSFNFDGVDGIRPYSALALDRAGNLYGTTYYGGTFGLGTVFELQPTANGSWNETVIHSFNADGVDGYNPYGGLVLDPTGRLYGTAYSGGNGGGIAFMLRPTSNGAWSEKIIHSFTYGDGCGPYAGLIRDRTGNLYGTTQYGGDFTLGTVFELSPGMNDMWTETVLHSFDSDGVDGYNPRSGVVIDRAGNLYGTCLYGGGIGWGVVYQLSPGTGGIWTETVIHSFQFTNDGLYPYGGLTIDAKGNLYGMTWQSLIGGIGGAGIVFELTPSSTGTWSETVLHNFIGPDGGNPYGSLILKNHSLYGTTYFGGNGNGVAFKIPL